jgi:hypothetical protein
MKWSKKKKLTSLPGTKENPIVQVDDGRNCYPTSSKLLSLTLLSKNHKKSTPWDLTFSPRSLREPAKSSKRASWPPRPRLLSTRPSEQMGMMVVLQGHWQVPHRQGKRKESGPRRD